MDKKLAAVCGLFCRSCSLYIATHEDPARLKQIAKKFNVSEEDAKCYGCRSSKRWSYCKTCKMIKCSIEKGIDFCGDCEEYPCEELKDFQAARPHRIDIFDCQERIKSVGYLQWMQEMQKGYSCDKCNTINSAYDLSCRKCGNDPSCEYVKQNKQAIQNFLNLGQ